MTFSDGVLSVYNVTNNAENGEMPEYKLTFTNGPHYFRHETFGVTRYYQALQANQEISDLVSIPDWNNIKATDIIIIDDGERVVPWEWDRFDIIDGVVTYVGENEDEVVSGFSVFEVGMVQQTYDEDGLKITRLTLERKGLRYELPR